jgi:hypothetical protein
MNGRLYDPKLHRFLQPDNYVQDASNTQNYNRYSYVLNNPLKYTDPSGEAGTNPNETYPSWYYDGTVKYGFKIDAAGWERLKKDFNRFAGHVGDWSRDGWNGVKNGFKEVGYWIGGWFKKGSSGPPPNMATNVNMNPYTRSGSNSFLQNRFAQSGGGVTFPSFSTLWSNYPPDVNGAHAHPSKNNYPNQCAIRVSDAFMKSGIDMSSYPKVNKTSDGYARSSKGFTDWTWQNFGRPKIMSHDAFERDYKNSTGLMYIGSSLKVVGKH